MRHVSPAVLCLLLAHPAGPTNPIDVSVGGEVRVSADHADWTFGEAFAAADRIDARSLMVCTTAREPRVAAARSSMFYTSGDGGLTWTSVLRVPGTTDPACAFGANGSLYAATLNSQGIKVFRSEDRGRTWQGPADLGPGFDREQVTVDQRSSRFRGRVYVDAMAERIDEKGKSHGFHIVLLSSADGGRSFGRKVGVPIGDDTQFTGIFPGTMAVLTDGTVIVVYRDRLPGKLVQVTTSPDGGEHLSPPVTIAEAVPCDAHGLGQNPQIAVDETDGAFSGYLYAVWSDQTTGQCQTMMARSPDNSKSWSDPIVIGAAPAGVQSSSMPNSLLPAVAVSNTGVIGVSWYAAAPDHRNGFALRFAASVDGGETFEQAIAPSSSSYSPANDSSEDLRVQSSIEEQGGPVQTTVRVQSGWPGDTQGLAADAGGVFHTFWYDNRGGVMQLWSAPVTIGRRANRNGSADLAALEDVTPSVVLEYGAVRYEALTRAITLDAVLRNKSARVIGTPLMARVVMLSSPKGELQVVGAVNGVRGPGAVWDWTSAIPGGTLNPSQSSAPVKLVLRFSGAGLDAKDIDNVQFSIRLLSGHAPTAKK
jgi:hypothetical protein